MWSVSLFLLNSDMVTDVIFLTFLKIPDLEDLKKKGKIKEKNVFFCFVRRC